MPPLKDLTGQVFGRLTVSHRDETPYPGKSNNARWACVCSCGNTKTVNSGQLRSGKTKSCGCLSLELKSMRAKGNRHGAKRKLDLRGQTFGKLTVVDSPQVGLWNCQCACGGCATVRTAALRSGHTRSCGCLRAETIRGTQSVDLTGQRYGRLVVQALHAPSRRKHWKCSCDCGKQVVVDAANLVTGNTKSCGCLRYENSTKNRGGYCTTRARRKDFSGDLYLYLMLVPFEGKEYPKIGLSVNPKQRAYALRSKVVYTEKLEANEAVVREQELHAKFTEYRAFNAQPTRPFDGYTECFAPEAFGILLKALADRPVSVYRYCNHNQKVT